MKQTSEFPNAAELFAAIKEQIFVDGVILANCDEVAVEAREETEFKEVAGKKQWVPTGSFSATCMLHGRYGDRYIGFATAETFPTAQEAIASRKPLIELARSDPTLKTPEAIVQMRNKLADFIRDTRLNDRLAKLRQERKLGLKEPKL